jgi:hypothetical protein
MSFYQTSAAVGKSGAEGATSRAVKTQAQDAIDAAEERIKRELSVFGEVWEKFQEPVLSVEEQPKQKLDRRRRSRNAGGCIVSDVSYEQGHLQSAQKKVNDKKKKDQKKKDQEVKFRRTWAPLIDKARTRARAPIHFHFHSRHDSHAHANSSPVRFLHCSHIGRA